MTTQLYGQHTFISGVGNPGYKANNAGSYNAVGTLVDTPSASPSLSSVQALLNKAYPGDVIQFKGGPGNWGVPQHTAVIESVGSGGVTIYQHLNSSHVSVNYFSWSDFYNKYLDFDAYTNYDKGITLYHHKSYDSKFGGHAHSYGTATYAYKSYNVHTVTQKCSCGASTSSTEACSLTTSGANRICSKCGKAGQPYGTNAITAVARDSYYIFPAQTQSLAISLEGGATAVDTNVRLESFVGSSTQTFDIIPNDNGTYAISNWAGSPGTLMGISSWSTADGVNVSLGYYLPDHQTNQWYIEKTPDGYYSFRNKYSNLYLDIYGGGTLKSGQNLNQWTGNGSFNAQKFTLTVAVDSEKDQNSSLGGSSSDSNDPDAPETPVVPGVPEAPESGEQDSVVESSIEDATVTLSPSSFVYDGYPKHPSVTVCLGGATLVENEDYTVSYQWGRTAAGAYSVTVTGANDYSGEVVASFTIHPADISEATASVIPDQKYTGSPLTPDVTLTYNGKTLDAGGTDYSLAYSNNVAEGTATIMVTGHGNLKGTKALSFRIVGDEAQAVTFSDVKPGAWYYGSVIYAAENGLITGYPGTTKFGPSDTLTRAQAAVILWRYFEPAEAAAYQASATANETGLPDVRGGTWYTGAANWAVENGVINGVEKNGKRYFDPDGKITRQQLCAIVGNAAETFGDAHVAGEDPSKLYSMPDAGKVSSWARQSVAWGLNEGVISGVNANGIRYIRPTSTVDRATMAAIMKNAIENGVI